MDVLNIQSGERVDLGDFQYAVGDSQVRFQAAVVNSLMTANNASWVLSGFKTSSPGAGLLQVSLGRALLGYRVGSVVQYGIITASGDAAKTFDVSAYAPGTYNVYVRYNFSPGAYQNRTFWAAASGGYEYAQNVPTRLVANWDMSVQPASPGSEWLQIATVVLPSLAITDTRNLYFEGSVPGGYANTWGAGNDRSTDRSTYGISDFQTFSAAMRQCIEDIKGPGLRRWWAPDIGGMNIGFVGSPGEDRLAVGDASFYLQGDPSVPSMVWGTGTYRYNRTAGRHVWLVGGTTGMSLKTGLSLGVWADNVDAPYGGIITSGNVGINQANPTFALHVSGSANITSAAQFGSSVAVAGALSVGTTLGVLGAATLNSTLGVSGASTLAALSATTGAFSAGVTMATTLGVSGAASFGSSLGVSGTATLAALSATNGAFSGTLGVAGASTLAALSATSGAFSGTLGVAGAATLAALSATSGSFSSAVTAASTLTVGSAARVADANTPLQVNAPSGAAGYFASLKNGATSVQLGYDFTGTPGAGGYLRMATADPLYFVAGGTLAATMASGGTWTFANNATFSASLFINSLTQGLVVGNSGASTQTTPFSGSPRVEIYSPSLGSAGGSGNYHQIWQMPDGNASLLELMSYRWGNGTSWTTNDTYLSKKVDATYHGFLAFYSGSGVTGQTGIGLGYGGVGSAPNLLVYSGTTLINTPLTLGGAATFSSSMTVAGTAQFNGAVSVNAALGAQTGNFSGAVSPTSNNAYTLGTAALLWSAVNCTSILATTGWRYIAQSYQFQASAFAASVTAGQLGATFSNAGYLQIQTPFGGSLAQITVYYIAAVSPGTISFQAQRNGTNVGTAMTLSTGTAIVTQSFARGAVTTTNLSDAISFKYTTNSAYAGGTGNYIQVVVHMYDST